MIFLHHEVLMLFLILWLAIILKKKLLKYKSMGFWHMCPSPLAVLISLNFKTA